VFARVRACVRACERMCVCVHACVHACVCACVHACVHACVCVCMRACVRACMCGRPIPSLTLVAQQQLTLDAEWRFFKRYMKHEGVKMGGFPYNKEQSCPIPSPPPSAQARGRLGWQVGDSAGAVPACEGEESACVRTPFCSLSLFRQAVARPGKCVQRPPHLGSGVRGY